MRRRLQSAEILRKCVETNRVNDFAFIVDGVLYECPRELACLVSESVRRSVLVDSSVSEFVVDVRDENDYFGDVMDLMRGEEVEIGVDQSMFVLVIAEIIGNSELGELVSDIQLPPSDITCSNVVYRIEQKMVFKLDAGAEIAFVVAHFPEVNEEELVQLPLGILEAIVSDPNLRLPNEEFRLRFIQELVRVNGDEFGCLFEYVQFDRLPKRVSNAFIEELDKSDVSGGVLLALARAEEASHRDILPGPDDELFADEPQVFCPPIMRWKIPIDFTDPRLRIPVKLIEPMKPKPATREPLIVDNAKNDWTAPFRRTEASTIPLSLDLGRGLWDNEYSCDDDTPEEIPKQRKDEKQWPSEDSSSSWSAGFRTETFSEADKEEKPESEASMSSSASVEDMQAMEEVSESSSSDSLADL